MADEEDKEKPSASLSVDDALKMYEDYKSHWSENYREAAIDLKMYSGDPATHYGNGWDDKYTAPNSSMVVDNELPQYVHQVTNDIRQNVPSIKVLPVSDGDIETGEIFRGLFRAVEDHSHADEVCDTAAESAVICSIGFMGLDHDYCNEDSDEQEVLFKTIPDALSEFLDPASVEYDGRDSNGHVSLVPINRKEFDRLYKGKSFISFTDPKADSSKADSIVLGQIFIREFGGERGKKITVRRYLFSGADLLRETTFPGKYIPRVPIYGEMRWIDGKRVLSSLIRQARSPQRRLNHMLSKESQVLAQAPIAPILAAEGTLVNERKQYQIPGLENALEYRQKDLDGDPAPPPIRLQPPGASNGFLEAIASAKEAIKASMGIYNAGLGKREGQASGIALEQLDRSGDVATFHYPDNVRRSYGHMGEIAIEMFPVIYDTPRIVQTLNDEADVVMVGINGAPAQDGQKQPYDLTKGKYRVRITTGASYTTKRQEEAQFLSQIAQKDPNFMSIGGDILFKSMDTPGAQALAARYKKIINPALLEEKDQPQIPPQVQQEMQQMQQIIQQGAQEIQNLQAQLENKNDENALKNKELNIKAKELDVKDKELDVKMAGVQVDGYRAETEAAMPQEQAMQPQAAPMEPEGDEILPEEMAVENADKVIRVQQANATLEVLRALQQQMATPKPIQVMRGPEGFISGAVVG
jgi:Tat protein secretion system quality control protein TatD with DNase activity